MSFFNNLKVSIAGARQSVETDLKKFKNKDVLRGLMAGCAYVAAADGEISPAEKQKMAGLVKNSSVTSVYDSGEAIKIFNEFADKFSFDIQVGKTEALLAISKLKKDEGQARLVIRGCIVIAGADGTFDEYEKQAVRAICLELGQNPADFDL